MSVKPSTSFDSAETFYAAEFINYGKYLASFSKDPLIQIFIRCLELEDIFSISSVNRHWRLVCLDSLVWESLLKRYFSHGPVNPKSDCRALYKKEVYQGFMAKVELSIWHGQAILYPFSWCRQWRVWPWEKESSCMHVTNKLLVVGHKNVISLLNPKTMQELTFFETCAPISTLITKNNYLCAETKDHRIHVWDVRKRCKLPAPWVSQGPISNFHITNHFLCARSTTGKVHVWNLEEREQPPIINHPGLASCLDSWDDCLYVGDASGTITAWGLATGTLLYQLRSSFTVAMSCLRVTADFLAVGSEKGDIEVIERLTRKRWHLLLSDPLTEQSTERITDLCIQGTTLYALLGEGTVEAFGLRAGDWLYTLELQTTEKVFTAIGCFSKEEEVHTQHLFCCIDVQGDMIVTGSEDGKIVIWDRKTGSNLGLLSTECSSPVTHLKINHHRIYARCENGRIFIWDFQLPLVGEIRENLPLHGVH
jgi:WD40 repeat protein